jgi:hypothetical protein
MLPLLSTKRLKKSNHKECPHCGAYKPTHEHVEDCRAAQEALLLADVEERRRVTEAAHARLAAALADQSNAAHVGHNSNAHSNSTHVPMIGKVFTWRPPERSYNPQPHHCASTATIAARDRMVNHVTGALRTDFGPSNTAPDTGLGIVNVSATQDLSAVAAFSAVWSLMLLVVLVVVDVD